MCRRITCQKCHKPTYAGCGMHIEQVLADVPVSGRCACREQKPDASGGEKAPWWKFW